MSAQDPLRVSMASKCFYGIPGCVNEWSPIRMPSLGLFSFCVCVLSDPDVLIFVLSLLDFISLSSLRSLLVLEQEQKKAVHLDGREVGRNQKD